MLRCRMAKRPEKLSSTLAGVLKARGLQGRLSEYRILVQWEDIVGAVIARHARPQSVRAKKLTLVVDSPAWMQQLSLLKPELIEKVNKNLGKDRIKDITLRLGEIDYSGKRAEEAPAPVPLDAEDRERIERYVREVADPETRAALKRLIEKDFQSRKRRK